MTVGDGILTRVAGSRGPSGILIGCAQDDNQWFVWGTVMQDKVFALLAGVALKRSPNNLESAAL
ncbi:MAG TPA: hypothetical protein VNY81_06135 [Candidatus Saccharimonadales bacterium]|nr:hypothetical protein [Candidatus Saccharimonadales bacterium]